MAAKMFAEVVIAGSYKNLAKSTRGATGELKKLESNAKKISNSMKAAFAGVVVLGLNQVWDGLVEIGKAAADDASSMAKFNKVMDNSWKASEGTKNAMNDYVESLSNATGILDDELRPALSKIIAVTKTPTEAMDAFTLSLDAAKGAGVDVGTMSKAMAKYLAGNKKAFDKLIPGISGATDKLGFLKEKFGGMATTGVNPFDRINVVMENFKEKLGTAILPLVEKFADWLSSPEAQAGMDWLVGKAEELFGWFNSEEGQAAIAGFVDDVKGLLKLVGGLIDGFLEFMGMVDAQQPETKGAALVKGDPRAKAANEDAQKIIKGMANPWEWMFGGGQQKTMNEIKGRKVTSGEQAFATEVATKRKSKESGFFDVFGNIGKWFGGGDKKGAGAKTGAATTNTPVKPGDTKITINGVVSGADVLKALKGEAKTKGVNMGQLLQVK